MAVNVRYYALSMVLMTVLLVPLSIQIALAIDLHPFAIVIPEILASNIGGAATLIGDPPSTIVGSHIGLGFAEYFVNMAPIAAAWNGTCCIDSSTSRVKNCCVCPVTSRACASLPTAHAWWR